MVAKVSITFDFAAILFIDYGYQGVRRSQFQYLQFGKHLKKVRVF